MREETARTIANVAIGAAALGAAVVILRVPALRRLAFGLARTAITSAVPAWLGHEIQQAWAGSAPRRDAAAPVGEPTLVPDPPGAGEPTLT
ncbi:MAG TPA: hypothetical protein VM364_10200 [Vicinamibacterales bacterium]|nr:hypothetical protein [Vicinamibacterales bacterium]